MIFDQPPAELPTATLVPRDGKTQLRADLYAWLAAKWRWFRPRTIPMIVAFTGMLAVIGSASWLRNYARRAPERLVVTRTSITPIEVADVRPTEPAKIIINVGPPGAVITIDGKVLQDMAKVELKPGCANTLHVQNVTPEPAPHVEPLD